MNSKRLQVYNDINKSLADIIRKIDEIKNLECCYINSKENKLMKLINYIEEYVKINLESIEELKKPFLLFIIGNGNYGKSTLINLLLQKYVVTTTDLPNTWKIDMFILDSNEKIEIIHDDSSYNRYRFNRGKLILEAEERKYQISKREVSKLVKEYKQNNKCSSSELKEIKIQLEEKLLYKSDIKEAHYYLKDSEILNEFIIVDTPGLNQNLLNKTKSAINYYYSRADGILWMLDAQNIISRESSALINEINEINNLGSNKKNIIGIVNKMDIVEKNNPQNIKKVKNKSMEIFRDSFEEIVFISAKKGLEGIINDNYEYIESSNVSSLFTSINNILKKNSEENQINSKKANLIIMRKEIINQIEKYKRELYADISKYNESEYSLVNQTESLINYVDSKLVSLTSQNRANINNIVEIILDYLSNIENICNPSLKKIYDNLLITSNISKKNIIDNLQPNVNLIKSKYISKIIKMKEIKINKNKCIHKLHGENLDDYFEFKFYIDDTIKNISGEIRSILQEEIDMISEHINSIRNNTFKENHTRYDNHKKILETIHEIEKILNNMEGINEK